MNVVRIPVVSETLYSGAYWYEDTYRGLREGSMQRGLELVNYLTEAGGSLPASLIPELPVILLGTSTAWFSGMLAQAQRRGLRALAVGGKRWTRGRGVSSIHLDFSAALSDVVYYLKSCGRRRIALTGVNPASAADNEKVLYYREALRQFELDEPEGAVFYNEGSLEKNTQEFIRASERFDAVVCPNDIAALELLRKHRGYSPKSLYVIGFGATLLGELVEPTLTTVTLHYREVGRQAVAVWKLLAQNPGTLSIDCGVECRILPRATTEFRPAERLQASPAEEEQAAADNFFYRDSSVQRMFQLELLAARMDQMDCRILRGVLEGMSYEALAETLNISDGTVKYRLKRMVKTAGFTDREELFLQIGQRIGAEALRRLEGFKRQ